jgi:hypothetical protein
MSEYDSDPIVKLRKKIFGQDKQTPTEGYKKGGAVKDHKHHEDHVMQHAAGNKHHSDHYKAHAAGHTTHKEHVEKLFKGK